MLDIHRLSHRGCWNDLQCIWLQKPIWIYRSGKLTSALQYVNSWLFLGVLDGSDQRFCVARLQRGSHVESSCQFVVGSTCVYPNHSNIPCATSQMHLFIIGAYRCQKIKIQASTNGTCFHTIQNQPASPYDKPSTLKWILNPPLLQIAAYKIQNHDLCKIIVHLHACMPSLFQNGSVQSIDMMNYISVCERTNAFLSLFPGSSKSHSTEDLSMDFPYHL